MHRSADISAAQIRAARAFLGLSQDELAEAAGITRKSLSALERGGEVLPSTKLAVIRAMQARRMSFVDHDDKVGILAPTD